MGVYIKGMELPHDCDECRLCAFIPVEDYAINRKCLPLNSKAEITIRRANCPLVPVPPHGRLIDADALLSLLDKCMFPSDMVTTSAVRMATNWIKDAPTIIPAEPTQINAPNTLDALTNTCPLCGGTLSEIRTDGKKKWRHCYSCHMEREVTE